MCETDDHITISESYFCLGISSVVLSSFCKGREIGKAWGKIDFAEYKQVCNSGSKTIFVMGVLMGGY